MKVNKMFLKIWIFHSLDYAICMLSHYIFEKNNFKVIWNDLVKVKARERLIHILHKS